jgi:hypothetical protein
LLEIYTTSIVIIAVVGLIIGRASTPAISASSAATPERSGIKSGVDLWEEFIKAALPPLRDHDGVGI